MDLNEIVGRRHTFEDGDSIEIIQVKVRDENTLWVTYHVQQGPGIPRKLVMKYEEFLVTYGHLFGLITEDSSPPEVS